MRVFVIAILGILLGGIVGAIAVSHSGAQETAQPEELESVRILETKLGEAPRIDLLYGPLPSAGRAMTGQIFQIQGQPGTWQIVTAKDMVLLLNSASGATFRLVQEDGSARWQPIEGQFPKVEAVRTVEPRRIEWPATPRRIPMPPEVDRPAVQDLRAMEELVRSFDNLITSLEARLRKETSEAEKAKIEARLEDLRADRKKAAEDLEKARAEDADQQHPAPRGR